MKIVKSLEDATLLIRVVIETVENEVKEQKKKIFGYVSC